MKYLNNPMKKEMLIKFCKDGHKKFPYSDEFKEKVLRCYGFDEYMIRDLGKSELSRLSILLNKLRDRSPSIILELIEQAEEKYYPEEIVGAFERGTQDQLLESAKNRMSMLELVDDWLDSEFEVGHFKKLNGEMTYSDMQDTYLQYFIKQRSLKESRSSEKKP